MKIKTLILTVTMAAATSCAWALDVDNTAGNLSQAVANPSSVTTLKVNGTINAADLQFIADEMPALMSLDLSGAQVVEYNGRMLLTGNGKAPANTLPQYSLAGIKASTVTLPSTLTAIADGALAGSAITSINIPAGVISIGMGAFSSCQSLKSVTIPASAENLGANIFSDCSSLKSVVVESQITKVPASAFARCAQLTTVTLPQTVMAIDSAAFVGCSALADFNFSPNLTTIGQSAFRGTSLVTANLWPCESLSTIGAWAFADNDKLETVVFPASVTTIGDGAFFHATSLSNFVYPENCLTVPNYAFTDATAFDQSSLGNSNITSIGDYALKGFSGVKTFYLPQQVNYLGDYAMEGWESLTDLHVLTQDVPELGKNVWKDVDQPTVKVYAYDKVLPEFRMADQWKNFNLDVETGIATPVNDNEDAFVRGFFQGTDMIVEAAVEIDEIRVFDTMGATLAVINPADTWANISTEGWSSRIYLLRVVLSDGNVTSLKLGRR